MGSSARLVLQPFCLTLQPVRSLEAWMRSFLQRTCSRDYLFQTGDAVRA
jgi:hypothetical protein